MHLVVTHPHGDHINGLPALREAFPLARVIAGEGAEAFVAHPKTGALLVNDDRYMTHFLTARGVTTNRPSLAAPPRLAGSEVMNDRDILDLGGVTLRFLHANGHAPGNLETDPQHEVAVLLVRRQHHIEMLFSSDGVGQNRALVHGPVLFRLLPVFRQAIDRPAVESLAVEQGDKRLLVGSGSRTGQQNKA